MEDGCRSAVRRRKGKGLRPARAARPCPAGRAAARGRVFKEEEHQDGQALHPTRRQQQA